MKNKTLMIIVLVIAALLIASTVLLKLGVFNGATTLEEEAKQIQQVASVEEMEPEKLYVWKDCKNKDIDAKNNTFQACPLEKSNYVRGKRGTVSANYTVWVDSNSDMEIPTLTSSDKLLLYSPSYVPDEYEFLRLYDNGYSFGITSLTADNSGHYYIDYTDSDDKAYEQHINEDSDASDLLGLDVARLYLDKVGKTQITDKYVSEDGIIKSEALKKDKVYTCIFYIGSLYQEYNLTANQHTFTALGKEDFTCFGYEYLHSNCVSIDIPDWLCSGYYIVNGMGMFRYVDDTDVATYNGEPYDENIDWNEPLLEYNERGDVIFDPSAPNEEEEEEVEEDDDGTVESVEEASEVDSAEWTHELKSGEKFTAEISLSNIVNTEMAVLTVTAPDGETAEFSEEDGKITVEIYEPKDGSYLFNIDKLGGRNFVATYSDGDTYNGPETNDKNVDANQTQSDSQKED